MKRNIFYAWSHYLLMTLSLINIQASSVFANEEITTASKEIWFDRAHARITRDIHNTATWFDNFFGDPRIEAEKNKGSYIRWKNEFSWIENDGFKYKNRTHINIALPQATKKLRLIYEGEKENNLSSVGTEDLLDPKTNSQKFSFRYILSDDFYSKFHIDVSVLSIKLRYRYEFAIGELFVGNITNNLFWKDDERFGDTIQFDLERKLGEQTLLRFSSNSTFSETSDGIEWNTGISLAHRLSQKNAISISTGVSGVTEPSPITNTYGIGFNFRRNFYRSWLFFDIEPQINWKKNEERTLYSEFAIMFRLEIQFEGEE